MFSKTRWYSFKEYSFIKKSYSLSYSRSDGEIAEKDKNHKMFLKKLNENSLKQ